MRTPFDVIELVVDRCALRFGETTAAGTCPAAGSPKCYNTWSTCKALDAFTHEPESWFFCTPTSDLPKDQNWLPFLDGRNAVSHTNGSIDPGKSLGVRSSITVRLRDHVHHDRTFDRYASERTAGGTFFGRLRARWPHYYGRRINWYSGFLGQSLAEMDMRTYVIERMTWDGDRVTITAKDPLKLADNDRAKAPRPSEGVLAADLAIDANPTTLDILTPVPTEYDGYRVVAIGSEIIQYSGTMPIEGGVRLTGVIRQAPPPYTTEREDHDEGDSVQVCLFYDRQRPIDVVYDLLSRFAEVPAEFLPLAEWEQEYLTWLPGLTVTRLIHKPEGVRDLLDELIQQSLSTYWWDERAKLVRFRAVRPVEPEVTPPLLDDTSNLVAGSVDVADEPDEQYNEVHIWYGQIDPAKDDDDTTNYRHVLVLADLDSQHQHADRRRKILTIYARWHPPENAGRVAQLARRTLAARVQIPRVITVQLDAKDSGLWTGDVADVLTRYVQAADGNPELLRAQVVQVRAKGGGLYEYRLRESFFKGRYLRIAPARLRGVSYFDASEADRTRYGAIAQANGRLSDGTDGWRLL